VKIDIFSHILPLKYKQALDKRIKSGAYVKMDAIPTLFDLDSRFRIMDKFEGLSQVLTLASPPVESVASPGDAIELSRLANDEMAELVMKHSGRFVAAVACLPMNNIDAALKETDRAMGELNFKGVQIYTSVNGKPLDSPEFMALYEKMVEYDLPIWIHPYRDRKTPDYSREHYSRYRLYLLFGWPYETTIAASREPEPVTEFRELL